MIQAPQKVAPTICQTFDRCMRVSFLCSSCLAHDQQYEIEFKKIKFYLFFSVYYVNSTLVYDNISFL